MTPELVLETLALYFFLMMSLVSCLLFHVEFDLLCVSFQDWELRKDKVSVLLIEMCSCFWLSRPFLFLSPLRPLPLYKFTSPYGSIKGRETLFPCLEPSGFGHRTWLGQLLFPPRAGTDYWASDTMMMRWLGLVHGCGGLWWQSQ